MIPRAILLLLYELAHMYGAVSGGNAQEVHTG